MDTIGKRIKDLRCNKMNMSQVAFANKLNVSKQTLYKYENDIITNIPSDKIEDIAKICGVSPAYLMGWERPRESTIGERIYETRKKAGLSQLELGKKLGVSQQIIAQFEKNKRNPKLETIEKLAAALNVPVIELLGDINVQPPDQYNKQNINYVDAFDILLKSLGYDIEFRTQEDLYLILSEGKIVCTFDTGDFFDFMHKITEEIKYCIKLKSFPCIDYMSDIATPEYDD